MQRSILQLFVSITIYCLALTVNSSFAAEPATQATANTAMQQYMKLMIPGEKHKVFSQMTGKWTSKMRIWNPAALSAPPTESTGETESRLILGGRFLQTEAKGSVMGMPMQRMDILGYDNLKKVYTLIFYSSMQTATNTASGTFDAQGKVLTLRGEFDEPEGKGPFKNVIRIESESSHVFESYKILPDGKELKLIEETYTRVP